MTFDQILEGEKKKEETAWSTVGAAQNKSMELLNNFECRDGRIGEGGGWMTNRSRLV